MTDLSQLPSVDQLLQQAAVVACLERMDPGHATKLARRVIDDLRQQIRDGRAEAERDGLMATATQELVDLMTAKDQHSLRRVINATGVILHTGLGRAPLAPEARQALAEAADHYCNLELDLATGGRGRRLDHVDQVLQQLTGAQATAVVNNNAAAVLLLLHTLAAGRKVVISRGQLVEIGGSFRMPDIIAASGARIQEVGTTNRTHLSDFEQAIDADTALLLVVHPSNYRVAGFTTEPEGQALVELGHRAGVPVAFDLGGGTLRDLDRWGLPHEPVVTESLQAGYDIVTFSGDKILGGPQCGILAGRAELIDRMTASPMMRALRCGKLTMAALEATLNLYHLDDDALREALPTLRLMTESADRIHSRATTLLQQLDESTRLGLKAEVVSTKAQAGSGALPVEELDSYAVACGGTMVEALAHAMRQDGEHAVVGRISQDRLLLDLRTVRDDEVAPVAACLQRAYRSVERL
ncbi:MAG: L-seryl-tRNA(Sec) selenium transferase [Gemmatimonadetes bacterium]|jgi:L-seryl-tRNA(Ser) seleniumtransferase|nr:L-seryl-tRNA(Sec) selenium transferase [Gemmatimonadota bacterium]MBT6147342.1 L-seryl-tRNA(Sec) selenium transferase [Gemmatimonadota bacterium]MBT7864468.1 L-seryl-tRNA(Sec) selenium transferase [Gemmatimonadota bacterium]